jgi:hypothetical protein
MTALPSFFIFHLPFKRSAYSPLPLAGEELKPALFLYQVQDKTRYGGEGNLQNKKSLCRIAQGFSPTPLSQFKLLGRQFIKPESAPAVNGIFIY